MNKPITLSVNVYIPLSLIEFKNLDSYDFIDIVEPALSKLGADKIEYHGMFGPNIWYTCEPEEIEVIAKQIETYTSKRNYDNE